MKRTIFMKTILGVSLLFVSSVAFSMEGSKQVVRTSVYQELVERESISTCSITSWRYNWNDWYRGIVTYRKTILMKTWLEDEHGKIVSGSLESMVQRKVSSRLTEYVHGTETSVLSECNQKINSVVLISFSRDEVSAAIERFLGK